MSQRSPVSAVALLLSVVTLLATQAATAAGLEVVVTTNTTNQNGIGAGGIALFINGASLPLLPEQGVSLGVGDVLRAELLSSAVHEDGVASAYGYTVSLDFILDPGTAAGMVQTSFSGQAEASTVTSQGSAYSEVVCNFVTDGCSAPGLPLSTAFLTNVISSTLDILPNQINENNVNAVTGRVGGVETVGLVTSLNLDRTLGSPAGSVLFGVSALAIFQAASAGSGSLELTVNSLTPIPLPAVGWLLAPILLVAGWLRRRHQA
jgi:hypothetical protein